MISFCYSSQHWNSQSVLSSKNHRYQHCHVLLLFIPENFQSYRGQPRQTPSQKDVLQYHQPNHRMSLPFCAQNLKTKASNLFECFGRVQLNLNCLVDGRSRFVTKQISWERNDNPALSMQW